MGDADTVTWAKLELNGFPRGNETNKILPNYRNINAVVYEHFLQFDPLTGVKIEGERNILAAPDPFPVVEDIDTVISLSKQVVVKRDMLSRDGKRISLKFQGSDYKKIVSNVLTKILEYTSSVIRRLKYETIIFNIFEDKRKFVVKKMENLLPDSLEKLNLAFETIKLGKKESYSHALTSCRRILKDVADLVYPATDKVINGHKLTDDKYINRIWEFLRTNYGSSSEKEFSESIINYLAAIIEELNDILYKGVHDDVTGELAKKVMIITFLILADLMQYYDDNMK